MKGLGVGERDDRGRTQIRLPDKPVTWHFAEALRILGIFDESINYSIS